MRGPSEPNVIYRNLGDGKFEGVSRSSDLERTNGHHCFLLRGSITTMTATSTSMPHATHTFHSLPQQPQPSKLADK
jgi:hypothetical protein